MMMERLIEKLDEFELDLAEYYGVMCCTPMKLKYEGAICDARIALDTLRGHLRAAEEQGAA